MTISHDDTLRLIEAAKCLALTPGSLKDRVHYAHKWYLSQLNLSQHEESAEPAIKELRECRAAIDETGGFDEWICSTADDSLHDYAVAIWDAYYAAVLKPAGY